MSALDLILFSPLVKMRPVEHQMSVEDGTPVVTHEGTIKVDGKELLILQFGNGQRGMQKESYEQFFGSIRS